MDGTLYHAWPMRFRILLALLLLPLTGWRRARRTWKWRLRPRQCVDALHRRLMPSLDVALRQILLHFPVARLDVAVELAGALE